MNAWTPEQIDEARIKRLEDDNVDLLYQRDQLLAAVRDLLPYAEDRADKFAAAFPKTKTLTQKLVADIHALLETLP